MLVHRYSFTSRGLRCLESRDSASQSYETILMVFSFFASATIIKTWSVGVLSRVTKFLVAIFHTSWAVLLESFSRCDEMSDVLSDIFVVCSTISSDPLWDFFGVALKVSHRAGVNAFESFAHCNCTLVKRSKMEACSR